MGAISRTSPTFETHYMARVMHVSKTGFVPFKYITLSKCFHLPPRLEFQFDTTTHVCMG